jgi:predicted restriction endonuclease
MTKLEMFFDSIVNSGNNSISNMIYENYENFDYEEQNLFELDVDFLATTIYKVKITEERPIRLEQSEFRKKVLEEYNNKCLITGTDCNFEIEAAHIVPHCEGGSYDTMNGLILKTNLHKTFDAHLWTINPDTMCIETNTIYDKDGNIINIGEIKECNGNLIELKMNDMLYLNLMKRYKMFKKKSQN